MVISLTHRTDDLYDPYCIVKTRPAESVHLVYQYLLLESSRAEYYVIWMKGGFFKELLALTAPLHFDKYEARYSRDLA